MNAILSYPGNLAREGWAAWNRFWFTPSDPATLGVIRICVGLMLLYTHAVWTISLTEFFGHDSWVNPQAVEAIYADADGVPTIWPKPSFWYFVDESPTAMYAAHAVCLVIFALFTVGLWTRFTNILAFAALVSYTHRAPFALFGLDQINGFLTLYCMIGPAGAAFSVDAWLKSRRTGNDQSAPATTGATVAVRLMQLHLCLLYFVAGISKLMGDAWWEGHAMWMAFGNGQYQTIDMTWLASAPWLLAIISHGTIIWEIFYVALIWPRILRPLMLFLAVVLHLGIGFCLGMMTFGTIMIVANMAFIPPEFIRGLVRSDEPTETPSPPVARSKSRERRAKVSA
jgi:hypothetical protein